MWERPWRSLTPLDWRVPTSNRLVIPMLELPRLVFSSNHSLNRRIGIFEADRVISPFVDLTRDFLFCFVDDCTESLSCIPISNDCAGNSMKQQAARMPAR